MSDQELIPEIEAQWFRQVLGQYPTGVAVVTGISRDGGPVGLAVSSFTSVSLDPPLVAFFPDKTSRSWPKIEPSGRFCVNVIGAHQEHVSRRFATKLPDKFSTIAWRPAPSGSPIVEGAAAWIDCDIAEVREAGDHFIVMGRVRALDADGSTSPLIFYQGGYGRFAPASVLVRDGELSGPIRLADIARPELERIAAQLGVQCVASCLVHGEITLLASAGTPAVPGLPPVTVGSTLRAIPPLGGLWMAFADDAAVTRWLASGPANTNPADMRERLRAIRERGYSVGLGGEAAARYWQVIAEHHAGTMRSTHDEIVHLTYELPNDPADFDVETSTGVLSVHAPVFDPTGAVGLALTILGPPTVRQAQLGERVDALTAAADRVTLAAGGTRQRPPRG